MVPNNATVLLLRLLDAVVVGIAFIAAIDVRQAITLPGLKPFDGADFDSWLYMGVVIFTWWHLLDWSGAYRLSTVRPVSSVYTPVLKASALGLLFLVSFCSFPTHSRCTERLCWSP